MGYTPINAASGSGSLGLNMVSPFSSALSVPNMQSTLPGAMPDGSLIQQMEMILSLLLQLIGTFISSLSNPQNNAVNDAPTQPQASGNDSPYPDNGAASSSDEGNTPAAGTGATPSDSGQSDNAGNPSLAGSTPQTSPSNDAGSNSPISNTQPPNSLNVKDFGARGDNSSDDQAAIQKALDSAQPGQTVWLPAGNYNHSSVLKVPSGVTLAGAGKDTVLTATDPNNAAVELTGSNSGLTNLTVTSNSDSRIPHAEASTVWVNHADGAKVSNVTSIGSGANNVTIDRSNNCTVDNVLGVGSNADGIAINNGSQNNTIQNSVVRESGDDSFSDDSYLSDEVATSGNKFLNNLSVDNRYGDNYKLAGATNDILDGNVSIGGPKGGIVVIQDTASGSRAATGNTIKNNTAIDLPAPDVSAFMVDGQTSDNNHYYTKDASESQQYIEEAAKTAGNYNYNKNYQAGTGPGANNSGGNHLYP